MARTLTPTALLVIVLALLPASARAGRYHVYACRTPSGQPAPVDGWSGSVAAGGAWDDYAKDSCAQGGALIAALGYQTTHGAGIDKATWAFEAPAGESIAGARLWRAGDTTGGGNVLSTYQFWLAGPAPTSVFDECIYTLGCSGQGTLAQPLAGANALEVPSANLGSHLYLNASCYGEPSAECPSGAGDADGYAAALYLYAADLVLEQGAGPSVGDVGGELASAPVIDGTSDLTFSASDPASGVYEALFSVDGRLVQSTVVDENGGRCRDVGQTSDGLPAFLYVRPCKESVSAEIPFDAAGLAEGAHHLIVSVIDAAGNAATVLDRQITVSNVPPQCAPGAPPQSGVSAQATLSASWKGTRRTRITSAFDRAQTIVGRLTGPGGAPIAGAVLDLVATPAYLGASASVLASPRTASNGAFSVRVPAGGPSRTLCLAYGGSAGATTPAIARMLALEVRAGIALRIAPRIVGVGRSIRFRGRLLGAPIPPAGKQLVLEARSAGSGWLEFRVIRAGAGGRFGASYTFKFPGPVAYQFRVLSEAESDFPFAAGTSNVVGVFER